jgi:hypothetical protein
MEQPALEVNVNSFKTDFPGIFDSFVIPLWNSVKIQVFYVQLFGYNGTAAAERNRLCH